MRASSARMWRTAVQSTHTKCPSVILSRPINTATSHRTKKRTGERDELLVDSQEYSKSGFDSWAAETKDTAFSSKEKNAPDEQLRNAEQESKNIGQNSNPLDVSPANRDVSSLSPDEVVEQTKVHKSSRPATPKNRKLPRYDERGDQSGFKGTGSYRTQNQEKPGPAFAATQNRPDGHRDREKSPHRLEQQKYVGGGR